MKVRSVGRGVRPRLLRIVRADGDAGNAIIEFVFVAVLIMVPLVYFIVAVAQVQNSSLAVTNAAREAGRAFATADSTAEGLSRALIAARLAEQDQGLGAEPELTYVPAGAACNSTTVMPSLQPGAIFTVCVRASVTLTGVPTLLTGRGITTVGEYVVHIDDFRTVPS